MFFTLKIQETLVNKQGRNVQEGQLFQQPESFIRQLMKLSRWFYVK
jgi:hypothetical protein